MGEGDTSLQDLRQRIDKIDDAIHDLLMQRSNLVDQIAAAKGENAIAMRPGREARVVRRILARHDGRFPIGVLVRIWREIIAACTALQQPLAVAVYEAEGGPSLERLARAHFGSMTRLSHFASESGVIRAITEGRATVGLLPIPEGGTGSPWWLFLARRSDDTPRIIARLPFIRAADQRRSNRAEALVLGLVPHEDSGDDHSFVIIEVKEELSRTAMMALLAKAEITRPDRGL
ncbi:MAG: chorismate mutase, partial [Kiloniellales bacterium]|nr:chorismate mutase [Kiloniellales bacterium]